MESLTTEGFRVNLELDSLCGHLQRELFALCRCHAALEYIRYGYDHEGQKLGSGTTTHPKLFIIIFFWWGGENAPSIIIHVKY